MLSYASIAWLRGVAYSNERVRPLHKLNPPFDGRVERS